MATQIPAPPDAPLRSDPATYAARREAWLTWEEDDLFPGINTIATEAEASAAAAAASAAASSPTVASEDVIGSSSTSLAVGTGSKVFTVQAGKAWVTGMVLKAHNAAGTMFGEVASYSGTTLTLTVPTGGTTGSGTLAAWTIFPHVDFTAPGPIGSATPSSGAFTTLSATGNTTVGNATASTLVTVNGVNSANNGAAVVLQKGGVTTGYLSHQSYIAGGGSTSNNTMLWADTGLSVTTAIGNGVPITAVSSTGLAVAGAVSFTSHKTSSGDTASTASGTPVTIYSAAGAGKYSVFCYLNALNTPIYHAVAEVTSDAGGTTGMRINNQANGGNMVISLSGTNIQATQTSGSSATIRYVVTVEAI